MSVWFPPYFMELCKENGSRLHFSLDVKNEDATPIFPLPNRFSSTFYQFVG
jgi:hypothetical protein